MQERAIHISSVDRQKIGQNKAEDFIIKFDPVLKLQNDMRHETALDKVTMTYSWHNNSDQYQNNKIKYSLDGGTSWEIVEFVDGMYSYSNLNDYLHQYMKKKGHLTTDDKTGNKYHIKKRAIKFVQLLSKKSKKTPVAASPVATSPIKNPQSRELSDYEINERVNQLLSVGRMRRFI